MFKNIPSICYVFFAVDDVIVTSVNTYMSMTGINTEGKYLTKSLPENKKYRARRLLIAGMTKYVSSVYLTSSLPGCIGRWSAALMTYAAGPRNTDEVIQERNRLNVLFVANNLQRH